MGAAELLLGPKDSDSQDFAVHLTLPFLAGYVLVACSECDRVATPGVMDATVFTVSPIQLQLPWLCFTSLAGSRSRGCCSAVRTLRSPASSPSCAPRTAARSLLGAPTRIRASCSRCGRRFAVARSRVLCCLPVSLGLLHSVQHGVGKVHRKTIPLLRSAISWQVYDLHHLRSRKGPTEGSDNGRQLSGSADVRRMLQTLKSFRIPTLKKLAGQDGEDLMRRLEDYESRRQSLQASVTAATGPPKERRRSSFMLPRPTEVTPGEVRQRRSSMEVGRSGKLQEGRRRSQALTGEDEAQGTLQRLRRSLEIPRSMLRNFVSGSRPSQGPDDVPGASIRPQHAVARSKLAGGASKRLIQDLIDRKTGQQQVTDQRKRQSVEVQASGAAIPHRCPGKGALRPTQA